MTDETKIGVPEFAAVIKAARELTNAIQKASDAGLEVEVAVEEIGVRDKVYKQVMVYVLALPPVDKG